MQGSPFVLIRDYLFETGDGSSEFARRFGAPELVPQTKPPWGTLAAIDTDSGKLVWEVPLGRMTLPKTTHTPEREQWGSIVMGGPFSTASGLVFIAGTRDPFLRAFDTDTGEKLWERELPAAAQSTPMSYELDGRQYVAVAAGGHGKLKTKMGDFLVVFALPKAD